MAENEIYCMKTDGFHGELFRPDQDSYPGKVLICFSGSDGKFELPRMLAQVFQTHGLTALALAYVMEEGLPQQFYHVPIDPLEAAAMRLHDMGYEKVGLWGISKGAELALTAGSLLLGLVNAVVAVAPMNTVCQGFSKTKGITLTGASAVLISYANTKIEELDAQRQTLSKEIAALSAESMSPDQIERLSVYLNRWEEIDFDDRRQVADSLISQIRATGECVAIEWKI